MTTSQMTMTVPQAPSITIGELEANYQLYCKALKMLIAEKRTLNKIQKTVCWGKLETLHHCLPRQYKAPDYLYAQLVKAQSAQQQ